MKVIFNTIVFLIVCCSIQALAQGDLHVKGKIRSDSLANQNYLIIYADSTGTLDTLPAGLPGQVLMSNGPGQKPTWTTIPSSGFNPLYPDGTDSLINVNEYISIPITYTVPTGNNLHVLFFSVEPFIKVDTSLGSGSGNAEIYANGERFKVRPNSPLVLPTGTVLSSNVLSVDSAWIVGYLAPSVITPVIQDLTLNPYTVPIGKTLYISYILPLGGSLLWDSRVFQNGKVTVIARPPLWGDFIGGTPPFIANEGDVLSTDNINNLAKVIMYGYLR